MASGGPHGLLLFDKPAGCGSNAALQRLKHLFSAAKAGHGGTLDPLASGLLPVLFGEATKFSAFLLDADKEYLATVRLGISTRTGDAEGEVVDRRSMCVSPHDIEGALNGLRGRILQTPPMYSALKHEGRALHELARKGVEVERAPRAVVISALEIKGIDGNDVEIFVRCSKGTYIRTLAEDIGKALGGCAYLAHLRRIAAAGFGIEAARDFAAIEALQPNERRSLLLDTACLLADLPRLDLEEGDARSIFHGRQIRNDGCRSGRYALFFAGNLVGVGEADEDGGVRPVRLVSQQLQFPQPADLHRKTLAHG